LEALNILRNT